MKQMPFIVWICLYPLCSVLTHYLIAKTQILRGYKPNGGWRILSIAEIIVFSIMGILIIAQQSVN